MNSSSSVRLSGSNFWRRNNYEMGYRQHLLHYQNNDQIRMLEAAIDEEVIGLGGYYFGF